MRANDPDLTVKVCDDCQADFCFGAHSVITDSMKSRIMCDPCFRFRARLGLEFSDKSRADIQQAVAANENPVFARR